MCSPTRIGPAAAGEIGRRIPVYVEQLRRSREAAGEVERRLLGEDGRGVGRTADSRICIGGRGQRGAALRCALGNDSRGILGDTAGARACAVANHRDRRQMGACPHAVLLVSELILADKLTLRRIPACARHVDL